jgi:hypothetical protein
VHAPRAGRHHLRETRRRWVHDLALGWLHIPTEDEEGPVAAYEQDDLTADDHLVTQTEKDAADHPDAHLMQPVQDPDVIPPSVVDEFGLDEFGRPT